jgi:hypothetical protein
MIGTISLGRSPQALGRYLTSDASRNDLARAVTFNFVNVGLEDVLAQPEIAAEISRSREFQLGMAALKAVAASRPDLRYTVAHFTASPRPEMALLRGPLQTRRDCQHVAERVAHELGLADRPRLTVIHDDGHSEWKARTGGSASLEHAHVVFALPDLNTGKSISLHRIRRRTQMAVRSACEELGLPSVLDDDTAGPRRPDAALPSSSAPTAQKSISTVPSPPSITGRKGARDRGDRGR